MPECGFRESASLPTTALIIAAIREKLRLLTMAPSNSSNAKVIGSVAELRRALKCAAVGTGQVRELIQSCSLDIGISGFTTLIATCGKRGHCDKAMEIFEAMESRGVCPNAITLTAIIAVFASAGRCDEALCLFGSLKELCQSDGGCRMDTVVYRSLIPALAKAKQHREVFQLFDEMTAAGFEPNRKILMAMVRSLSDRGRWSEAAEIIESMHNDGMAATRQEYTDLIVGCCRVHGWDYVVEIFITMQLMGVDVNSEVCGALMCASEECGEPEMGIQLLSQMEKFKIEVSLETYNCLLRGLAKQAMWEASLTVFRSMYHRGVKIDKAAATALVNCCASAGKTSLAEELERKLGVAFDQVRDDGHCVSIPGALYASTAATPRANSTDLEG